MVPGFATPDGTRRFSERFPELLHAGHFRQPLHASAAGQLWFPSIGLGTYLGNPDSAADQLYTQAAETALLAGINLLDTAINYRHQRSERNLGEALRSQIAAGQIRRDEVIVCSKAGYLSFDAEVPEDARGYLVREYVETKIIDPAEVANMHCMAPRYLENQIERSRRNLDLETIDVYYLHNPESQMPAVPREQFHARLRAAFQTFEHAVKAGKIRFYGIASWNAFRVGSNEPAAMSLTECLELARAVGGENHHLRFIQLPYNLAMPEAYSLPTQVDGHECVAPFEFARRHGLVMIGSASLYQGQLAQGLPLQLATQLGMDTDAARALQFARSAPGLTTALVGMGRPGHVLENVKVAQSPQIAQPEYEALFVRNA